MAPLNTHAISAKAVPSPVSTTTAAVGRQVPSSILLFLSFAKPSGMFDPTISILTVVKHQLGEALSLEHLDRLRQVLVGGLLGLEGRGQLSREELLLERQQAGLVDCVGEADGQSRAPIRVVGLWCCQMYL